MTLYNWRKQAREQGVPVPGNGKQSDDWSGEAKLASVVETAGLSEVVLIEYCRSKGLYPEQIKAWREACVTGEDQAASRRQAEKTQTREDKKRIKELERELRCKDKALSKTAALLALRKS